MTDANRPPSSVIRPVIFHESFLETESVKIAVCLKRVPDMDVRFKIAASGKTVDEKGIKFDMSDFEGYAVEAAMEIT